MGSSVAKQRKKLQITNQDELRLYTDVIDPILGYVKIYTCRKYNLCYILKYEVQQQDTKIYNIFKKVQVSQLNPLLSLYGFHVERKTCCNQIFKQKLSSYWEYYNFYFNQYLARRRHQNLMLIDSEIWHIVQVCCQTYNLFRKFGIYYQITPQTFVITPQGKLKAFWCHIRTQNSHLKFFQYFDSNYKITRFPYAPQELHAMHQHQRGTKIDFDKCNSYRLGILLLQCLSLTDPLSNCYNPSMTAISGSCIRNLIVSKVVPHYPVQIINIIRCLLRQDPKKRPTLNQIYDQHFNRFSPDFELRVCGVKIADSIQSHHDDFLQLENLKLKSDFSDDKTVKLRHSIRKV